MMTATVSDMIRVDQPSIELLGKAQKELAYFKQKFPELDSSLLFRMEPSENILEETLVFPRGYTRRWLGPEVPVQDQRVPGNVLAVTLDDGKLDERRQYQDPLVQAALQHDEGILVVPTGGGKTVIAALLVAAVRRTALVVVSTARILQQFVETFRALLDVEPGVLGGGIRTPGPITVALRNSLKPHDPLLRQVGLLLVDEAHHVSARTYLELLGHCPAQRRYGLTATIRKTGDTEKIVFAALGPILGEIPVKALQAGGHLNWGHVRPLYTTAVAAYDGYVMNRCWFYRGMQKDPPGKSCPTLTQDGKPGCTYPVDGELRRCIYAKGYFGWVYKQLSEDQVRNDRIVEETQRVLSDHPSTIVLTHLTKHADHLGERLKTLGVPVHVAHGKLPKAARDAAIAAYVKDQGILVAVSSALGEGFNAPRTTCMVRAMPAGGKVSVRQQTGRAMRPGPRRALIVDFVDRQVPWLNKLWMGRRSIYGAIGFQMEPKPS